MGHKMTVGLNVTGSSMLLNISSDVMSESRKEREFKLREKDILSAATTLFLANGLDSVTVADIAKATDIGKGTIYKHFTSKDAVLAQLANNFSYDVLQKVKTIDITLPAKEQMREMLEMCFMAHVEEPLMSEISRRYHQASFFERLPEQAKTHCLAIEGEYFVILQNIFSKGIENNELPNASIDELLLGAHATFTGALEMLHSKQFHCFSESPSISQERFIKIIINYTMTGLFGQSMAGDINTSGESHE